MWCTLSSIGPKTIGFPVLPVELMTVTSARMKRPASRWLLQVNAYGTAVLDPHPFNPKDTNASNAIPFPPPFTPQLT